MSQKNRRIVLRQYPVGVPVESDFDLVVEELGAPGDGELLIQTQYLSVDPYLRGLMTGKESYMTPVRAGEIIPGGAVGTVLQSSHGEFKEGDVVSGYWGWQEYAISDGEGLRQVDASLAPISTALGVLGMPGMTAYFGLLEIGKPKEGEQVFVSAAAGAVGSLVGQIAKVKGCRVVGSCGSAEKVRYLKEELGLDEAFDYTDVHHYGDKLREVCPEGIDVYFDNVGGPLTDAVFNHINLKARIVLCGQIDQYNDTEAPKGPRVLFNLIPKQARAEGFMVFQFSDRFAEGQRQIAQWLDDGKISYRETVSEGIESTPEAFIGLFSGENIGKQVVRVA